MGARQSKRSVDITTTPKKDGVPAEGSVAGDAAAPGDGKLERIEETDGKPTTNGTAPHTDAPVIDEKSKDKELEKENDNEKEKDKDEDNEKEDVKVEDTRPETNAGTTPVADAEEATTPTDGATPTSPDAVTSPDSKDAKKKDKKKKWSFRSLSFGKRDRSKTAREDAPKNGDVTKEEPLAEGGEEAEVAVPVEESSAGAEKSVEASSPIVESTPAPVAVKEEEKAAAPVSPTPVEEKKEEPTPAPTPVVPVEEKKEEIEKVEAVVAEKVEIIVEPEVTAPVVENEAEISTTESVVEAPASPAPPVPAELPVLPPSEPAITEDVASVTKAIEENDISDKAVAAAVNEAIESANTNEIVTDSHHQKLINE